MTIALSSIAAFMTANPLLFEILRWLSVGYLAWMDVSILKLNDKADVTYAVFGSSRRQLVGRAIVNSMSNPKANFSWLAVFSQFVDAAAPLTPQLIVPATSALSVTVAVYVGYCALGLSVKMAIGRPQEALVRSRSRLDQFDLCGCLAIFDFRKA